MKKRSLTTGTTSVTNTTSASPTSNMRVERDTMGELPVPSNAYYGVQTARAIENFPISSLRVPRAMIRAVDGCGVRAPKKEQPAKGGPFFTGSQHVQAIFTSICFGFAFSDFGKCRFNTPSAYSARTLPSSTVSGSVKLRTNRP